jgi:hypothetical protein
VEFFEFTGKRGCCNWALGHHIGMKEGINFIDVIPPCYCVTVLRVNIAVRTQSKQ